MTWLVEYVACLCNPWTQMQLFLFCSMTFQAVGWVPDLSRYALSKNWLSRNFGLPYSNYSIALRYSCWSNQYDGNLDLFLVTSIFCGLGTRNYWHRLLHCLPIDRNLCRWRKCRQRLGKLVTSATATLSSYDLAYCGFGSSLEVTNIVNGSVFSVHRGFDAAIVDSDVWYAWNFALDLRGSQITLTNC
jgi:hypothetical protein